jgi:hypothetical protein
MKLVKVDLIHIVQTNYQYVEKMITQIASALGLAVEYYEEDTADYIDSLYELTVLISMTFSAVSILYYALIIRPLVNKLTQKLHSEVQFLEIIGRSN